MGSQIVKLSITYASHETRRSVLSFDGQNIGDDQLVADWVNDCHQFYKSFNTQRKVSLLAKDDKGRTVVYLQRLSTTGQLNIPKCK